MAGEEGAYLHIWLWSYQQHETPVPEPLPSTCDMLLICTSDSPLTRPSPFPNSNVFQKLYSSLVLTSACCFLLGGDMTVHEGTGAPRTCWKDLARSQADPWLQVAKHDIPVSALACLVCHWSALVWHWSALVWHSCSPTTGSNSTRLCRRRMAKSSCTPCLLCPPWHHWCPYWKARSRVGVRLRMPFHSHCSPAITFLSPNPSPTRSLLQDCTYPVNSLVIPRLPFLPFKQLLSIQMESGLFLLWGAVRGGNLWPVVPLLLQYRSAVCLLCKGKGGGTQGNL